ncbi:uncharacterized protein TRAVEDRAFT_49666 [Trametes versicolor FP-101664 SS1]|uniref:uncharacterized protein n=1 Tax=Trametes versicolor (strain FP-101664) TaxID=717944 RepID=UPI000462355C|nr:uncharacterized protein TRAVEDRAFT_49666 [Trametes versicolor FP-101664 SS1]EIW56851.1 hypothetical protein TRAVEDRAFT_49666 [Trametes versicolor FP-101664 SS1]
MIFEWLSCMDGMYVSSFGSRSSHSIEIMRVCKFWTNIAMNTVSLWQKIEVRTRGNWLAIALPRSKGMPLDVIVHDADRILSSTAPLLVGEAPRLRSLKVLDAHKDKPVDVLENAILAVDRLPCLETLVVEYLGNGLAPLKLYSFSKNDRFPALHFLDLNSLFLPWTSSIFRQLRYLRIHEACVLDSDEVPLSVFLDMLRTCQCLEILDFPCVSFIDYSGHEHNRAGCAVFLPRIRSFHWEWPDLWAIESPTHVYHVLEHLQFPPSADIHLDLAVFLDGDGSELPRSK